MQDGAVLLLAKRLDYPLADFLTTLAPFTQIFRYNFDKPIHPQPLMGTSGMLPSNKADTEEVCAAFVACEAGSSSSLKISKTFETALSKWKAAVKDQGKPPVVVLCGGVNSGKSTLSRYMINSALSLVTKVAYLDCDIGQSEFSPPGTVALTVVNEPVFGPPFCHPKQAASMCFYGNPTPAEDPGHYVECLQHVYQAYRLMESPVPLIVNTMGWHQDVGLQLFVDVLHLLTPDLVIQINVANKALNFPEITPEFPVLGEGWLFNTDPVGEEYDSGPKKHELITIDSLVPNRTDLLKVTPKSLRDLMLVAHLMNGMLPRKSLLSAAVREFPWAELAFYICSEGQEGDHNSVCGSVVGLCSADLTQAVRVSETLPLTFYSAPVCECIGLGVVKCMDQKKLAVYIITPLPEVQLQKVNTLVKGSITLPDQFLLRQNVQTVLSDATYVDSLEATKITTAARPRTRMPRRKGP